MPYTSNMEIVTRRPHTADSVDACSFCIDDPVCIWSQRQRVPIKCGLVVHLCVKAMGMVAGDGPPFILNSLRNLRRMGDGPWEAPMTPWSPRDNHVHLAAALYPF